MVMAAIMMASSAASDRVGENTSQRPYTIHHIIRIPIHTIFASIRMDPIIHLLTGNTFFIIHRSLYR